MRCLLFLWSDAALSRLDVGFFILRGCINKNKASLFYVFLLYSANINRGFRRGFLRTENRKRILPHKRTVLFHCVKRSVLPDKTASLKNEPARLQSERRNAKVTKSVLLCGKIPFLFSSVCQIPFRLFFRKNRLFFLKIPSLETAISCLAFWVLRMASSSFL